MRLNHFSTCVWDLVCWSSFSFRLSWSFSYTNIYYIWYEHCSCSL